MARDLVRGKLGGVLKTAPRGIVAAAATSQNAHLLTAGRRGYVRKLTLANNSGGDCWVRVGTGAAPAAFVPLLPRYRLVAGMNLILTEDELPDVEFLANPTIETTIIAGAGFPVEYQLEVEETR